MQRRVDLFVLEMKKMNEDVYTCKGRRGEGQRCE